MNNIYLDSKRVRQYDTMKTIILLLLLKLMILLEIHYKKSLNYLLHGGIIIDIKKKQ